jgi:hypothetical protein
LDGVALQELWERRLKRRSKILLFVIGTALVLGFLSLIPASYKICEINQYTEHEHCTSHQVLPFLFIQLGKFLDSIGVAVTALATIAIALFTFYLKRSTDRLWEAGERQLEIGEIAAKAARRSSKTAERAFTKLERPYVFIFGAERFWVDPLSPRGLVPYVSYDVANYGKTPAVIQRVLAAITVGRTPGTPGRLPVTHDLHIASIMPPDDLRKDLREYAPETLKFEKLDPFFGVLPKEVGFLPPEGEDDLFFRVTIRYRGAFSDAHESCACWRWDMGTKRLVQYGGDEYNYVR